MQVKPTFFSVAGFLAPGIVLVAALAVDAATTPARRAAAPSSSPAIATPDVRGTTGSPLAVDIVKLPERSASEAGESAAAEQDRRQEEETNRRTMYFTGGLLVVASLQAAFFVWQLIMMRSTVRAAADAASAARLNARAAIGIELPVLRVLLPDLVDTDELIPAEGPYAGGVTDGPPGRYSAISFPEIKNFGRTPAFPEEISVGWMVASELPVVPRYLRRDRPSHASVIEPDGTYSPHVHYGIELSAAERASAASGTAWLWVYGVIQYRDFLQTSRKARFCWRYANQNVDSVFYAFASDGGPPSAYVRSDGVGDVDGG